MVKTLELKVEEKFRKDRISKDQMAEAVKPGFLRWNTILHNLSIQLKIGVCFLDLQKLVSFLCTSYELSKKGPRVDLEVEMKTS